MHGKKLRHQERTNSTACAIYKMWLIDYKGRMTVVGYGRCAELPYDTRLSFTFAARGFEETPRVETRRCYPNRCSCWSTISHLYRSGKLQTRDNLWHPYWDVLFLPNGKLSHRRFRVQRPVPVLLEANRHLRIRKQRERSRWIHRSSRGEFR